MFRALFVLVAVSFLGCGVSTVIDGKQYKTTCSQDSDCVGAFFGDQCGVCACPNAAIAASDRALYEADRTNARVTCGPQPAVACSQCPASTVSCASGTCSLK